MASKKRKTNKAAAPPKPSVPYGVIDRVRWRIDRIAEDLVDPELGLSQKLELERERKFLLGRETVLVNAVHIPTDKRWRPKGLVVGKGVGVDTDR